MKLLEPVLSQTVELRRAARVQQRRLVAMQAAVQRAASLKIATSYKLC